MDKLRQTRLSPQTRSLYLNPYCNDEYDHADMKDEIAIWHGGLQLSRKDVHSPLSDITLKSLPSIWTPPIPKGDLELLAYINPSLVPLHLLLGPSLHVGTTSDATQTWFSAVLMDEAPLRKSDNVGADAGFTSWDDTSLSQSRVGVLVKPSTLSPQSCSGEPRVTEILFFAERRSQLQTRPLTPPASSQTSDDPSTPVDPGTISVRALLISSDLQLSPPQPDESPAGTAFLAPSFARPDSAAELSRKRLGSMFDEADARRKRARSSHGQSISLAAARTGGFDRAVVKTEDGAGVRVLQGRRVGKAQTTSSENDAAPRSLHARKVSLASSAAGPVAVPPVTPALSTFEQRNKEGVSRIVLAGMRMQGLQARKGRGQAASAGSAGTEDADEAEFKGVYHQAYKGVLFAFRREVGGGLLAPERVRDVADRLLAVFCEEPP